MINTFLGNLTFEVSFVLKKISTSVGFIAAVAFQNLTVPVLLTILSFHNLMLVMLSGLPLTALICSPFTFCRSVQCS